VARIGVFICQCGTNIAKTVDTQQVVAAVAGLPDVVAAFDYKYMCSDPGQRMIKQAIAEHRLTHVVVASCTPTLHESTFQVCIQEAGLNPYLLDIANIREQCSWVHHDKETATAKAIQLVRMAVAKVAPAKPLFRSELPVTKRALVIGGGIAGLQAALDIANAGFETVVVERQPSIGGRMAQFDKTFPTMDCSACILTPKMVEAARHPKITIHTWSELEGVTGYVGNFEATIRKRARSVRADRCSGCGVCYEKCPTKVPSEFNARLGTRKAIFVPFPQAVPNVPVIDRDACRYFQNGRCGVCAKLCPAEAIDYTQEDEIITEKFGAIVIATGYDLLDPSALPEYGGGKFPDVITGEQFERLANASGPTHGEIRRPSDGKVPKTIVFVKCAGSRDDHAGFPYCSKVCCMYTAKHCVLLKERIPDSDLYVFYMDVRTAGKEYEEFYRHAQEDLGVKYLRGRVSRIFPQGDKLRVKGADSLVGGQVEIDADLVVLATAMTAQPDAPAVARMLTVPQDRYHFFTEAHPKLRPVESVSAGIFMAGACQFPRDIPDSVSMASGAAAKAIGILAQDHLLGEPTVATVNQAICSGCQLCVNICPYTAITTTEIVDRATKEKRLVATVNEALCQGCGACVAACRPSALNLRGFADEQLLAGLESLCLSP
jgi:heterodisulfide reductase subunit A